MLAALAASLAAPSMWPCTSTTRAPAATSSNSSASAGARTASSTEMDRAAGRACLRRAHQQPPPRPAGRKHSTGPPAVADTVRCSPKNGNTEYGDLARSP